MKMEIYLICFVLAVTTAVTNAVTPMDEHWPCLNFPSISIDLDKISGDYYLAHYSELNEIENDFDENDCGRFHISHPSSEEVQLNFTHKSPGEPLLEDGRRFRVYKNKTGRWFPIDNDNFQVSIQALTDDMILFVLCLENDPTVMRNVIYSRWKEITPQRKEEIWKVIRTTNMQFYEDALIDTNPICINELPPSKF